MVAGPATPKDPAPHPSAGDGERASTFTYVGAERGSAPPIATEARYSTVTVLARLRGWSTSLPLRLAT